VRLRRSQVAKPGGVRRRHGKVFSYLEEHGTPLDGEQRDRVRALAIPPAWRDVWICPWPNLQAVGIDEAGRKQYLYHEEWRRQRDAEKYDRVLELAPALPDFRRAVAKGLRGSGFTRTRVLAASLRMLDQGVFRTGGEEYVERSGSYGVSTLLREHVTVSGDQVSFDHLGTSGVHRMLTLADPLLAKAKVVSGLKRTRSGKERLLVCRMGHTWHDVHADDVNERFHELVGDEFSVKDLRTWNATVLAATVLAGSPAIRLAITRMYREVAEHLGNTPAVTKKSYVDPRLVEMFERGATIAPTLAELGSDDLTRVKVRESVEHAVHELLT
jgi:DNA topoisomerase-1